jgi:hypothetical protein
VTRVLLITPGHDDFLIDGLLHGLRELLGDDAVELPRCDHLYKGYPAARRKRLHGLGFVFGDVLAADSKVDRDRALYRAVEGEYDLVIFGDIWRCFGQWVQWMPKLRKAGVPMAVIDSSDRIEPYPFAGEWWRTRVWWTLPRIRRRATYFKRESSRWTGWFRTYLLLPPPLAPRIRAKPISFGIPASLITHKSANKTKDFPAHIVDPEVAERLGASTEYAFGSAAKYRADLEAARFGITTKKAGWDALRHYEIAAAGTVPCFRDLSSKPAASAPHGLIDGVNCIAYSSADELLGRTGSIDDQEYERLREGALAWAAQHTTRALAEHVLSESGSGQIGSRG